MESAWINRLRAAVTCHSLLDLLAAMIGRTCRLTPSLTQLTISAWVRIHRKVFFQEFTRFSLQKSLSCPMNLTMMSRLRSSRLWTRKLFRSILKSWKTSPEKTTVICRVEKYDNFPPFSPSFLLKLSQISSSHGQISTLPASSTISTTWRSKIWQPTARTWDESLRMWPALMAYRTGSTHDQRLKFKFQTNFYNF